MQLKVLQKIKRSIQTGKEYHNLIEKMVENKTHPKYVLIVTGENNVHSE